MIGESKGKIFRCDGGDCASLKATETSYRKKAPEGWRTRQGPDGTLLMACSEECGAKIDTAVAPAWKVV